MRHEEIEKGRRWALVTGGSRGIGMCYAEQLAGLGYNIIITSQKGEGIDIVQREIVDKYGVETRNITMDLARAGAAQELFDRIATMGIEVDVLINNAGVFSFLDVLNTSIERIERLILLHDMTTTICCRLFAAEMAKRGGGYILNMSSFSLWMPFPGLALYGASKAYLRTFSVAFAKEVCENNIRVTAVCPAGVATDLYGLSPKWQRIGLKIGVLITPESCAKRGLKALWRGRRCVVPDWWNRIFIPLCRIMPMCIIKPIRKSTIKFQK